MNTPKTPPVRSKRRMKNSVGEVPRGEHPRGDDHTGQEQEDHIDPVHAEEIADAEAGQPRGAFDELQPARGAVVREEDPERQAEGGDRGAQRHYPESPLPPRRYQEEDQHRDEGKRVQCGEDGELHLPAPRLMASRTTSVRATPQKTTSA
jgi:hypothetical protein